MNFSIITAKALGAINIDPVRHRNDPGLEKRIRNLLPRKQYQGQPIEERDLKLRKAEEKRIKKALRKAGSKKEKHKGN